MPRFLNPLYVGKLTLLVWCCHLDSPWQRLLFTYQFHDHRCVIIFGRLSLILVVAQNYCFFQSLFQATVDSLRGYEILRLSNRPLLRRFLELELLWAARFGEETCSTPLFYHARNLRRLTVGDRVSFYLLAFWFLDGSSMQRWSTLEHVCERLITAILTYLCNYWNVRWLHCHDLPVLFLISYLVIALLENLFSPACLFIFNKRVTLYVLCDAHTFFNVVDFHHAWLLAESKCWCLNLVL